MPPTMRSGRRSNSPSNRRACIWNRSRSRFRPDAFASERFTASVDVAGPSIRDGDIARLLRGRQPAFRTRRAGGAAFAAARLCDRRRPRDPGSARHAGAPLRARHACGVRRCGGAAQSDAGDRTRPALDRGDGGLALYGRAVGAGGRRGRSRRRGGRYGRRNHHHRGVLGRPIRPCRRLCCGRHARHHGSGARTQCKGRRCRANQDVLWHCCVWNERRARYDSRARGGFGVRASRRKSSPALRWCPSSGRASKKFWR